MHYQQVVSHDVPGTSLDRENLRSLAELLAELVVELLAEAEQYARAYSLECSELAIERGADLSVMVIVILSHCCRD